MGLVLYGTAAKTVRSPDYPWGATLEEAFQSITRIERHWGESGFSGQTLRLMAPSVADDHDFRRWWRSYLRVGASPATAAALGRMNAGLDVRHVLPAVRVPTLVVHRTGDPRRRGGAVPGGAHPGGAPGGAGGDRPLRLDGRRGRGPRRGGGVPHRGPPAAEPDRVLATVLFMDIVGSTASAPPGWATGAGGPAGRHHALVRARAGALPGREVDTAGDGLLATFDGPARASAAPAHHAAVRASGSRCGPGCTPASGGHGRRRGGDRGPHRGPGGGAGRPGEVLVSSTVKDLVAGSGIEFEDRGEHALKGIPEARRLFAVVG